MKPLTKKIVGVFCIIAGLLALVTPFTPGAWLFFVGLEFLGLRALVGQKVFPRWLNERLDKWFPKKEE